MIYFLRRGDTGDIKIGTTTHLPTRIGQHGYKWPVSLLGVMDGGRAEERAIHRKFADLQLRANRHGRRPELFRPAPELIAFINENCREPDLLDQLHERRCRVRPVRLMVPESVHSLLRLEAAKQDLSLAALARMLVEDYLKRTAGYN